MSVGKWMFQQMNRLHPWLYRRAGGKGWVASVRGMPVLLLTTTGRRSGTKYTNVLGYIRDGDDLFVAASAGGMPRHPAWALNLRAKPDAEVQVGSDVFPVRGEWAKGEERDRLWHEITTRYPFFAPYEAKAGRTIPVIRLRRQSATDASA